MDLHLKYKKILDKSIFMRCIPVNSIDNHLVGPSETFPASRDQYLDVPSDGCRVLMAGRGDSYRHALF